MSVRYVQAYVVQCKSNGLFLTEDLRYAMTLKKAGRLYDLDEAQDTGAFNLQHDFEIHTFFEKAYGGEYDN